MAYSSTEYAFMLEAALSSRGRLVGAQLIRRTLALDFDGFVERWLGLAKPALELVIGRSSAEMPVGASRLWGDPDLPPDAAWPTLLVMKYLRHCFLAPWSRGASLRLSTPPHWITV